MESLPVTLIVKAPNQQIEDQRIQCEPSWTIHKLKQHLSEVYPSKPPKHEQKLIYSGKLLNDSVVLKDILRQYEGQDTHTVHLVCTPKYTTPTVTNQVEAARRLGAVPIEQTLPQAPIPETNADGYADAVGPAHALNVHQYSMQIMMMQQAYMQYITQYMNMAAQAQTGLPAIPPEDVPVAAAVPRDEAPAAQAAAPVVARDPELNRDWLDVFYMLSRVMIFISIVYFYSSPVRCIFVVLLGLSLYLYQIGFFRNVNNNNNNIVRAGEPDEAQQPTRLMVLWTFFTTFFASLIPEIPNVV